MGAVVRTISVYNLILSSFAAYMSFILKTFPVILLTQIVPRKGV